MEAQNDTPRPGPFGRLLSLGGRAVHPFERLSRRLLGRDGDLKVLAVLAAVVVYILVEPLSAGIERQFSVPVRVMPAGRTTAVVGVTPSMASVTLRGRTDDFTAFNSDDLCVELRPTTNQLSTVADVDPLNVTNKLSAVLRVGLQDVKGVPDRFRIVGISTNSVTVDYDYMSKMPVFLARPRTVGAPVQGTAVASFPTNLSLTAFGSVKKLSAFGAKRILLPTDAIDVEGKTESFDAVVEIRPPEDSGITSVVPSNVTVHVEIRTRAAIGAGDIHVSAPILLKSEDVEPRPADSKPADSKPAEPESPPNAADPAPTASPAAASE